MRAVSLLALLLVAGTVAAGDADRLAKLRAESIAIRWSDGVWRPGTVGQFIDRGGPLDGLRSTLPADDVAFLAYRLGRPGPVVVHPTAVPMPPTLAPADCPPGQP